MTRLILAALVILLASPAFAQTSSQVDARIAQMHQANRLWQAELDAKNFRRVIAATGNGVPFAAPARRHSPQVWTGYMRGPAGSYFYRRVRY